MLIFTLDILIEENNKTIEEINKELGISIETLNGLLENKYTSDCFEALYKLSIYFDITIKELFYENKEVWELRKQLSEIIDETGINSKETMWISKVIDKLMVESIKEELKK